MPENSVVNALSALNSLKYAGYEDDNITEPIAKK